MDFLTTGDIAKKLGTDRDAVAYALRKTNVEPAGRAGLVRLFPGDALATVQIFLNSKATRKEKQACCA